MDKNEVNEAFEILLEEIEAVTKRILDDLVTAFRPRWMKVEARFNVRGGIYTTVTAEYRAKSV